MPVVTVPETYAPVIRQRRARRMREEKRDRGICAPIELEKKGWRQLLTVTLLRPIRMLFTEAVVGFSCLYLALAYAIFCTPVQFLILPSLPSKTKIRHRPFLRSLPPHLSKHLPHKPWPLGPHVPSHRSWRVHHLRPLPPLRRFPTARQSPLRPLGRHRRVSPPPTRVPRGPCIVLSLFWLGWTSSPEIHWIAPTLAGIPFGVGYLLIFTALLNYLTDAYEVFAASAMAASTCSRCLGGALLPFVAGPMYGRLGIAWASSLLGFLSLGMCAIPFVY